MSGFSENVAQPAAQAGGHPDKLIWPRWANCWHWPPVVPLVWLVCLELAGAAVMPLGATQRDESLGDYVLTATVGASLAPPMLLALWAALGPGGFAPRLAATFWLLGAFCVGLMYADWRNNVGPDNLTWLYLTAWPLSFVFAQLPLWLLRAVGGWRLETAYNSNGVRAGSEATGNKALANQFSLRALLGWTALTALLLATLGLNQTVITDEGLLHVARLKRLIGLDLANTRVTDAGLAHLADLPFLLGLDLRFTDVTDDGLMSLARLPELEAVDVSFTAVSETAAKEFCRARPRVELEYGSCDQDLASWLGQPLTTTDDGVVYQTISLTHAHLRGTKTIAGVVGTVTDAALAELAKHPELEELDLRETAISDAGLAALENLPNLKRLDLRGTAVSELAVSRLARNLPGCEILSP